MEEREKLLALIYPNGYPADWKQNKTINEYLTTLGTYKVETLIKEPQKLRDKYENLQEQTQELAVTNYRTFIDTAECSKELSKQFNRIENKVDHLLNDIPNFQKKCTSFSESSGEISNLRKLNSLTLTRNAQLLEILELPQLMNSFIDNEQYEEALELAAYVRKLSTKYNDIPVLQSILADVNSAWYSMLHQLLSQLKQELTLPKCLHLVGHLRRMEVFTELELKLKYLQARGYWLEQRLKFIPTDDINHHLSKVIEVTRVNLFNIITQYQAIFSDENPMKHSINGNLNENIIFYTWINDRIADFLSILQDDLKYITSVESILEQCMYFGLSFSKVGCDFRTLLIPIFTKKISDNFKNSINKSIIAFEKSIENFTLINKTSSNIPWKSKEDDPLHPPDSLLEFYPLAEYLNNILKILNDFKTCAPIAIINDVVDSLEKSLKFIAKSILTLHQQEQQAFTSQSKDAFSRLCQSFADDLIPYIQKCIHIIYPLNQLASKLGISVQKLQEEKMSFLNKDNVLESIKHLIPVRIEPSLNFEDLQIIKTNDNNENVHNENIDKN